MYLQAVEVLETERKKGHFNTLLRTLWALGFTIVVPNPLRHMERILQKKGFQRVEEPCLISNLPEIEIVYRKQPPANSV